ncbi:MAG TPA: hypothetical protein VGF55_13510 [Gemmataceae bacterium]|jgi:hypothetical protein
MKALLLGLCAAITIALSAAPAHAGLFRRDPTQVSPYHRYGSVWRFYNYEYKGRFHPEYSFNYHGYRQ